MENASKALLIAGGVLLAILVLTVGIHIYNNINGTQDSYIAKLDTDELVKYNNPYEVLKDRKDISAQEIVSVVGDSKQKNGNIKIKVYDSDGKTVMYENMQKESDGSLSNFLNNNIQYSDSDNKKLVAFQYVTSSTSNDGRINEIIFQKIGATKTTPITGLPTNPEDPDPPGYWEDDKPTDENNERPHFTKGRSYTSEVELGVEDPENDLVEVNEIQWVIVFPEDVYSGFGGQYFNELKDMAKSYRTLDYTNHTGEITNADGSTICVKGYSNWSTSGNEYNSHIRYSAKKYDMSDTTSNTRGYRVMRLPDDITLVAYDGEVYDNYTHITATQFMVRDNKHMKDSDGGWVYSDVYYSRSKCEGGTPATEGMWYKYHSGGGRRRWPAEILKERHIHIQVQRNLVHIVEKKEHIHT